MAMTKDVQEETYMQLMKSTENGDLNTVKKLFDELAKENIPNCIGREVLRKACLNNQLHIIKFVIEHKNQKALNDFNSHYGFIFWTVTENKFWNIANYFICDLDMPLSWDLKRAISSMDKDDAEKINHMFEMRTINKTLQEELINNHENNIINKKLKI